MMNYVPDLKVLSDLLVIPPHITLFEEDLPSESANAPGPDFSGLDFRSRTSPPLVWNQADE
jgi:hypothetical protein